jgi:hypothetical protein
MAPLKIDAPKCNWNIPLVSSKVWSVFRRDLNVEQAREVFHAAHESVFAMIQYQLYARL